MSIIPRVSIPTQPPTRTLSRARVRSRALWGIGAVCALLIISAFAGSRLAKAQIANKIASISERFGIAIEVQSISVPIVGAISLEGVEVSRRSDARPIATMSSVETDLTLLGAIFGRRRPEALDVSGLRALVRWEDGLVDFPPSVPSNESEPRGDTTPLEIRLSDAEIGLEIAHTLPAGRVSTDAIRAHLSSAVIVRDAARNLSARAVGRASASARETPFSFELTPEGRLELSFDAGAHLGVSTPSGPLWLALNGLDLTQDGLRLKGLGLRHGQHHLAIQEVASGPLPQGPLATLVPRLLETRKLSARGITLSRGDEQLSVGRADLDLASAMPFPLPSRIRLGELGGTLTTPGNAARLEGRVASIDVGLTAPEALVTAFRTQAPLDALTDLRVAEPTLELILPPRTLPENDPAPAADGDPPPIIGNDDDLPAPTAIAAPILAPGSDWLGALLGSETPDESLLDLIPAAFRAKLPNLLARVTALKPRIERATIAVKETDGPVMLTLEDASFSARVENSRSLLAFAASVMRNGAEAAHLDLELDIAPDLTLESISGKASGRSLAHQLARFVPRLSVQEDAAIDLSIAYRRPHLENAPHHVEGRLAVRNFSFEYWRIADREIRDLEAAVKFDASIDRRQHRILLDLPTIEIGEARLKASLDLTRKKGALPSFIARLEMPRQDCGAAARSIPRGLIPNLSTLALEGQLEFKASLDLDLANPTALDLIVEGDGDDCRILSLGPGIDPLDLRGPYVHHPREPRGVLEHIAVGPGTDEWVPAAKLPELVTTAAWVTEDRRWTEHSGVRWDLVERALKMDLDQGRFVYGGSTITQQLVKNIYLTRTKNLARKFEEAIIAWQVERVLTKEEIITLYVNCIEYGPEIYGIRQAARIYFNKKVKELDALEIAFIMGLKPYPKAGYAQFRSGQLNEWWIKRVSHVLEFISKFAPHLLTAEDVQSYSPFQPKFATW